LKNRSSPNGSPRYFCSNLNHNSMKKVAFLFMSVAVLALASCSKEGPEGPAGSTGATGPAGAAGVTAAGCSL
jgi:hypothetical protein